MSSVVVIDVFGKCNAFWSIARPWDFNVNLKQITQMGISIMLKSQGCYNFLHA